MYYIYIGDNLFVSQIQITQFGFIKIYSKLSNHYNSFLRANFFTPDVFQTKR